MKRLELRLPLSEQCFRSLNVRDVRIVPLCDVLEDAASCVNGGHRVAQEECAAEVTSYVLEPLAEEGVPAAQVVIEERQRGANCKRVQPQRYFGELDRHGVPVDTVDGAFEHHATDEVAIVELAGEDRPPLLLSVRQDVAPRGLESSQQGGSVADNSGRPGLALNLGKRLECFVGEVVHEGDEKVAAPHCGVAHCQ